MNVPDFYEKPYFEGLEKRIEALEAELKAKNTPAPPAPKVEEKK